MSSRDRVADPGMPRTAFENMPCASELLRHLGVEPGGPRVFLIRGRSGTGKSTLLAAARARLRARGIPGVDHSAWPITESGDTALIIDDIHTLSRDDLAALRGIFPTDLTVVIAARPRPHDPELRAVTEAVARQGRVIDLRPLGPAEIGLFAGELGMPLPPDIARRIHQLTGGNRGGVVVAATAWSADPDGLDAAVVDWARTTLADIPPDLLDTLAVATTGGGLDADELAEVLGLDRDAAIRLVDDARATPLITDEDMLLDTAVTPLRARLGERRFVTLRRNVLTARLEAGLLHDHTALMLAETGLRDQRLADFLCAAAEKAGNDAVRCYAAAAAAGADGPALRVRWAEAAACAGDAATALLLAEPLLDRPDPSDPDLATAVRVCASVLTRRGRTERAARLYAWLGPERAGADRATGATVLILAGDPEGAAAMTDSADRRPPTEAAAQAAAVAEALSRTLRHEEPDFTAATSALVHAAHGTVVGYPPCTPVSVAVLLCLATGEPGRAAEALRRAGHGDSHDPQLGVLAAWTAMLGGDEASAAATAATFDPAGLEVRDRLLAHGVLVGLARRGGDQAALARAWRAAQPLLDDVDADLLALLPIGELWLAGIRLRDERRITPLVRAARALLHRLGEPPAWANIFHWYGVQAAIAHECPDDLLPHAHALKAAAAGGDRYAAVLARAGRIWVRVLRGQVAAIEVEAAVTELSGIGLSWDAARLAGDAALAAADATTATALLKLARTVRTDARPPLLGRGTGYAGADTGTEPADLLSEREREVAELVLLGHTYREIGARLFISAKTVEHHVARIRRRLGADSRSELLAMLRVAHGDTATVRR